MGKQAGLLTGLFDSLAGVGRGLFAGHRGMTGALLLSAGLLGGTAGWVTAKATSHTDSDYDLAKKEYENEQTKADLAYLSQKLNHEFQANKNVETPKSMRLLNA